MEFLLGLTMTVVMAVIGWAFNIHSRLSVVETRHQALLDLIGSKFDDLGRRLERIEHKLWNGGSK